MRPADAEQRRRLMAALDLPEEPESLPQSLDREPPSEAAVFMAKVVLACVALFVFVLGVIALGHVLREAAPR